MAPPRAKACGSFLPAPRGAESRLLNLVRRLPNDFVEQAVHFPDTVLIGNDVSDIARIKNRQKQQEAIERILLTANEKFP